MDLLKPLNCSFSSYNQIFDSITIINDSLRYFDYIYAYEYHMGLGKNLQALKGNGYSMEEALKLLKEAKLALRFFEYIPSSSSLNVNETIGGINRLSKNIDLQINNLFTYCLKIKNDRDSLIPKLIRK